MLQARIRCSPNDPASLTGTAAAQSAGWVFSPTGTASFPGVWSQANQTAARSALTGALGAGLLTIAVTDYTPQTPVLFFKPGEPCNVAGATITADGMGRLAAATRRRRLHAASGVRRMLQQLAAAASYNVTNACDLLSVTWKVAGTNGSGVAATAGVGGVYSIQLENSQLPDSVRTHMPHCCMHSHVHLQHCRCMQGWPCGACRPGLHVRQRNAVVPGTLPLDVHATCSTLAPCLVLQSAAALATQHCRC